MSERDLFLSAIAIPDPAARSAFLDRACGGDPGLRRGVDQLLAAHAEAGSFLDPPPAPGTAGVPPAPEPTVDLPAGPPTGTFGDATASYRPAPEVPETVIAGRYKLLEPIGEGGMGTVWMAQQTEPVKRRVAVKLVRSDRGGSRAILARFEAERQAIALMDHPHIAKLLDAGATAGGEPFFVMELVRGVPLTQFCDARRLTVPERLDLFRQICGAVQHAHQKGIIHRDLKPSNVLVESHDGKPVPKVIDFGLAKAVGGLDLTDRSVFTGFGAVLGTPSYMAPEQATLSAVDVDTRADVYALGVILYELLAGSPPIRRDELKRAALEEMLRAVREDEPPPPSSRISGSAEKPSIAANRQTEPARLGRFVRGELDWVVMKALAKDRDRRYETAAAFGADVGRFLNHEPVAAGPPSAGYKLRKFVARNRGRVAAAGLVLLALVAGVVGTTLGLVEARRQRDAADAARQAEADRAEGERKAKNEAVAEKGKAEGAARAEAAANVLARKEAGRAAAVNRFLLVDLLGQADPKHNPVGARVTVRELLDRAAAAADRDPAALADPEVEGAVRHTLGKVYHRLGVYPPAEAQLRRAVDALRAAHGPADPRTLDAAGDVALALRDGADLAKAEQVLTEYLAAARPALGPDADPVLSLENNLGLVHKDRGDHPAAERLFRRAWDRYRDAPGADPGARCLAAANLAWCLRHQPDPAKVREAYDLYRRVLPDCRAAFGPRNPTLFGVVDDLGQAARQVGRLAEAEAHHREAWAGRKAAFGDGYTETRVSLHGLGLVARDRGDPAAAAGFFRAALDGDATPGEVGERFRATAGCNLALALAARGELAEADRLMDAAFPAVRRPFGLDHPEVLLIAAGRAEVLFAVGRWAAAEALLAEALPFVARRHGAESAAATDARRRLGEARLRLGKWAAAEADLRAVLAVLDREQPGHWATSDTRSLLGGSLFGRGELAEAEPLLVAGYEGMKARRPTIPPPARPRLPEAADRLVDLYQALGKPDEVKRWRAERATYPFVTPPPREATPKPPGR